MSLAVQIDQNGGPEQLKLVDVTVGQPGPGEIRIRHKAIGLNFIDVYQRSGLYTLPMPLKLGMEASGIVEAVGEGVTHLKVGDRAAYASQPPGSYCEERVMPAKCVCKLPDDISFETGAAMMLKGLTAQYLLLKTRPVEGLKAGDHVLFHAAAGGGWIGFIAIDQNQVPGNFLNVVKYLVEEHGADVGLANSWGYTPLHYAAARGDVAMIDQKIDRGAQAVNRLVQTLFFKVGIVGNKVRDHDARFVHHGMAEADAIGEGFSRQRHPATKGDIETRLCEGLQLTRGDHLRQHHGGGLQRLDLFFGIEPVCAVLDNHDAERVARPQDGNAEEGLIDFFARLGLVREGRMGLGIWKIQGFGLLGDQTDKAFTRFHRC